jgi:NAD(P) transhydrogenase subunit alpha
MLLTNLAILVLAGFTGYLTISKVPNTLHTPLMSGTNAIHGIVVLGGIIVLGLGVNGALSKFLLVVAVAFGTINVVGGFLVTDRMLEMFKSKPQPQPQPQPQPRPAAEPAAALAGSAAGNGSGAMANGGSR